MALELKGIACQDCGEILWKDTTGSYDVDTNPGGYGGPGAPANPDDFDSYTLSVWKPKSDLTGPADFVLDLLPAPTPDTNNVFSWTLTPSDFGADVIVSGLWYFKARAVYQTDTVFTVTKMTLMTEDIQSKVDVQMMKVDPSKECACSGKSALLASNLLSAAKFAACCGKTNQSQEIIDWLYVNVTKCNC